MVARILSWKYRHEMKRKIRQRAEQISFKIIQRECFPQELTSLMANQRVQRDSRLLQFRPCVDDDGIIRANRRLLLSDLDENTKYPIVLADHNLTVLLLQHIHESNMHLSVEGCVAFAQRRFAVVACRRIVRRIKKTSVQSVVALMHPQEWRSLRPFHKRESRFSDHSQL